MSSRGSNALHQSRAQEVGIRRPRLQGQKPELHIDTERLRIAATCFPDLIESPDSPGERESLHRVCVTTADGVGNGVGCTLKLAAAPAFAIRPESTTLLLPPGMGRETLVVVSFDPFDPV